MKTRDRFIYSEEIAAAAVFLASEEAGYVNGATLAVDGGRWRCSTRTGNRFLLTPLPA